MRTLLLALFLLTSTVCFADNVAIYDTRTGEIVSYLQDINSTPYVGCTDCVINPDVSKVISKRYELWMYDGATGFRIMTPNERSRLDEAKFSLAERRTKASALFDGNTPDSLALRCFARIVLNEINTLRENPVTPLPARTQAQLKNAIQNCVSAGTVEE